MRFIGEKIFARDISLEDNRISRSFKFFYLNNQPGEERFPRVYKRARSSNAVTSCIPLVHSHEFASQPVTFTARTKPTFSGRNRSHGWYD